MSKLLKVEDAHPPQVGRFYLVPCVRCETSHPKACWMWPVIGPWHEDADIGTNCYHYHFDIRFFSERQLQGRMPAIAMIRIQRGMTEANNDRGSEADKNSPPPIVYRRLKMRREMPEFPNRDSFKKPKLLVQLEATFKSVKMKCMTCPHRGMSLRDLPTKDGTVVCNGHGLKWDLATGAMIERE